jgi:threonylcarbamoyladenosine tRNA methylthiotransferase MtaB
MNFHIKNFGCRLNQFEGEELSTLLQNAGCVKTEIHACDILIVNGCAVTARTEQKINQFVRKFRRDNPETKIIITGCIAQGIFEGILSPIECAEIVAQKNKFDIERYIAEIHNAVITPQKQSRARASIKIQDGCDNSCSYCIVPLLRGKSISLSRSSIVERIREFETEGYREVVLTGVDIGSYRDNDTDLPLLLGAILEKTSSIHIRLSSLEPQNLSERLTDIFCRENRIAPHLHLPLQSGSETVLCAMNRHNYRPKEISEIIAGIRSRRHNLTVGADIIVGYPIETDSDFAQTVSLLESGAINYAHIFPFSPRPQTQAFSLKPIMPQILRVRLDALHSIDSINRLSAASRYIGKTLDFIVEKSTATACTGHTDNYLKVIATGTAPRGSVASIIVEKAGKMTIEGKIC